jgi:hypothetical protein
MAEILAFPKSLRFVGGYTADASDHLMACPDCRALFDVRNLQDILKHSHEQKSLATTSEQTAKAPLGGN